MTTTTQYLDTILPTPNLFSARRVLCIQPHYDDNDIGAAGTLIKLRRAGAELIYVTVTDDLMGVVDDSLSADEAAAALRRDQTAAAQIIGVDRQFWLGYPDAGEYGYFDVRRDLLRVIRQTQPDFILTVDPWLTYEGHRDHIQTGFAAAEATMFAGLTRIASSDPAVDAAYEGHQINGIAFYFTREPNLTVDITDVWPEKEAVLRCYEAQFSPTDMESLVAAMAAKAEQAAIHHDFKRGEPIKVLDTSALHIGL